MIQSVGEQLAIHKAALAEKAAAFSGPISLESVQANPNNPHIRELTFPNISERAVALARQCMAALEQNPFIQERESKKLVDAVNNFLKKILKLEKVAEQSDEWWAAECTMQMLPNTDYREAASVDLQNFVFNKLLEVISGQKNVLEIDLLDFPAVNLFHRHEVSATDFYQADGATFLEYASLRNLFSLLDTIASKYAKSNGFKIKLNIRVEDMTAQKLYAMDGHQDFNQASQAYLSELKAWQAEISSHYPQSADQVEINWLSEQERVGEDADFEQTIATYEKYILRFWLTSEKFYQQIMRESGATHWSEVKKILSTPGADQTQLGDRDESHTYRSAIKGLLANKFTGEEFYDNLPGKDSLLQIFTPLEKEGLLRQVASVIGKENLSYRDLTFDRHILRTACQYLARKIYFEERRKAQGQNLAISFGQSLPDQEGVSRVIVYKPLGGLSKARSSGTLALNRGADMALGRDGSLEPQPKYKSGTVIAQAHFQLHGGSQVPVMLRLSPDDLSATPDTSHVLQRESTIEGASL